MVKQKTAALTSLVCVRLLPLQEKKALLGSVVTSSRNRQSEEAQTRSKCPLQEQDPKPAARHFALVPTHGVTLVTLRWSFPAASQQPEYFICFRELQGSLPSGIIPSIRHCPGTLLAQALPALEATREFTAQ